MSSPQKSTWSATNGQTRKSSARQSQKRLRRCLIETLEDRRLLALTTDPLGAGNEIVFRGDASADTVQFSVVDGFLQHNLGGRPGFESGRDLDAVTPGEQSLLLSEIGSLTFDDVGENDRISFQGNEAFNFAAAALSFSVGEITVSPGVNISTTAGAIDLMASETILVNPGASIRTVDGGIALTANRDASTSSANTDYFSLYLDGAILSTSGDGPILLEGTGIHSGSNFSAGVGIEGGTTIESTSQAADAGEIRIVGIGADGSQSKHGVIARDAGNSLTSAHGDISIDGTGGFRSGANGSTYWGIYITGLDIASTGTGPDAAEINITGVGGNEVTTCYGVFLRSSGVSISSVDGDISIVGRGGQASNTSRQTGVLIEDVAFIRSTGTGVDAANISIDGVAGTATAPQTSALVSYGVQLTGDSTELSTIDGDISITGSGGDGGVSRNGVSVDAIVSSTGTGTEAGNITISGQGGTTADGWGTFLGGSWSTVDGDINISGAGSSSQQRGGEGVRIRDIDLFTSSGVGPDAGNISITGSAERENTLAVILENSTGVISTVDGDITLRDTDDSGILVDGFGGFASTGTGQDAGKITIVDKSVRIQNLGTGISSVDGDILLASEADEVSGTSLVLSNFGVIESTGTGPNAATITLIGTASDGATGRHGLSITGSTSGGSTIRTIDGDISITGTGGDRTDATNRFSENRGVTIANVTIESIGTTADAARVTLSGIAGSSGRNGHGVYLVDSSISSVHGDVLATGTGTAGDGVYLLRTDTSSTGVGSSAADVTLTGNRVRVASDVRTIDGNFSAIAPVSSNFSGSFVSTGEGTFTVEATATGAQAYAVGTIQSTTANIVVRGSLVSVGGIHSTGTGSDAADIVLEGHGVFVTSGELTTVDGGISIASQEDAAESTTAGVFIRRPIRSTGTGADVKPISISSIGFANSQGVNLQGGSILETVDADILVSGQGSSEGIEMSGFGSIVSSGVGENAGAIRLVGVSPGYGINADGNNSGIISTVDGEIELSGTGTATNSTSASTGLLLRELDIVSTSTLGLGGISLLGIAGSGTSSGYRGVDLSAIEIQTNTGDIFIQGQGGNSLGSSNTGILTSNTTIHSTGIGAGAGTITLDGTGGGGGSPHGVWIGGTEILSHSGDIHLTGQGGTLSASPPSRSESKGLRLSGFTRIESTGRGEHAANITIAGTGGSGRSLNSGVEFTAPDGILTTRDGDISIVGVGGSGESRAIVVDDWQISSTGIGADAGTITLDGTGGGSQAGIFLESLNINNEYAIESIDGDITLTGRGTPTAVQSRIANSNHGIGNIRSSGLGEFAADIRIDGGDGSVSLSRDLTITSIDGGIKLEGSSIGVGGSIQSFGSSPTQTQDISLTSPGGANLYNISTQVANISLVHGNSVTINGRIESSLSSADAGTITMDVSSPTGNGISFGDAGEIVSTTGDIHLTGSAGGTGYGIQNARIKSLGTDKATAASITLVGSGSDHGGSGILIAGGSAAQPNITTIAGDIDIQGTGGSGTGSRYRGVYLANAYIESTGVTKDSAGAISIVGVGGSGVSELIGVDIRSSQSDVISKAGDIAIIGTAGVGTGSHSYGLQIRDGSLIQSSGTDSEAANIRVEGTSASTWGVYLASGRIESPGPGKIEISATGIGDGTVDDLFITGGSVLGGPGSDANIEVNVDSLGMQAPAIIQTWGDVSLQPRTPDTTVALGSGIGELSLDNAELALFDPGTGEIIIGSETQPVASIDLAEVVAANTLTLFADSVSDQSGVDFSSIRPIKFAAVASPVGRLQIDGSLFLESTSTLQLDVNGPAAGAVNGGYDQIQVRDGLVIRQGAKLETSTGIGYPAAEDQQFVIIDNDGTDPILGNFDGLPEGTVIENFLGTPLNARISYLGLDGETGNDVVLTTTNVKNPIYNFSASEYSAPEGDVDANIFIVSLERSEETSIPSTVDVVLTSGTALAGVDFRADPITVNFAPGQTTASVAISVLGERLVEDDETLTLSLDNLSDYGFAGTVNPTATLTLVNDEFAPVASFTGDFTPREGTPVTFDASGSSDVEDSNEQLLFEWDFDFSGTFSVDAVGEQVQFAEPDGPASQVVALRVTDTEGNVSQTTNQVETTNVAPVVFIPPVQTQIVKGYNYAELNLPLPFVDPGSLDSHIVEVNYGDGSPAETIELTDGERGFSLNHRYKVTSGTTVNRTITINITDSDGGTSNQIVSVAVEDLALTVPDNRPTLSIRTRDVAISERETYRILPIDISLDRSFPVETFIPIDLSSSTATLDSDYQLSTTLARFAPYQTTATLFFNTINDTAYEPSDETVVVGFPDTLEVARVTTRPSDQQFFATIRDDGDFKPSVSLSSTRGTFDEGDVFELTVSLSDVAQEAVLVPLSLYSSEDVSLSENSVLIPAGQLSESFTVTVIDDELSEPQESFGIGMQPNAQRYPIKSSHAFFAGTIRANDAILLDILQKRVTATEGGSSVQIVATASEVPTTDLVLPLTYTSNDATVGGDFIGPASIRFEANRPPRVTFSVNIVNDQVGEEDELVFVNFATSLPNGVQLANPSVGTDLLIEDDDVAKLAFVGSASTTSSQDGESYNASKTTVWEDSDAFELTVSTGGISFATDVSIPISFSGATRGITYNRTGSDLQGPSSSVTLPAGETTVTFTVSPVGDNAYEPTERGYLALGTGSIPGAKRGKPATHEIVIKDNDPLATITTNETNVDEDDGTIQFTVKLSAASNRRARIPFKTYGSATNGDDYTIVSETRTGYKVRSSYVEIEPGQRVATIKVKLKDDAIVEGRETLGIWLRPEVGSTTISNANLDTSDYYASVLIGVDEVPKPTISQVRGKQPGSSSYSSTSTWVNEGGSFRIRVSMPSAADRDVWVPVSFPYASGRASSLGFSQDFTTNGLSNGWLKIPAFKKSAYFYLHTVDDLRKEDSEKIRATIGQPVVWDRVRKDWVNFGSVGSNYYKFVGIRSSDQDTVYCPTGVQYGSLAISDGCVVDAGTTSSGPTLSSDWTAGSVGSLQIVNGYLSASEVFLDGNFNGQRDFIDLNDDGLRDDDEPLEPLLTTFSDGSFLLDFPAEMDRNGNGLLDADEAQLVAFGGTDPATGITERTRLTAPAGSFVVTPLTTLASKLVNNHGFTVDAAHQRVLDSLRLPTFEYWRNSAISATVAGDVVAAETYPITVAVNNTAIVVGSYLSELSEGTPETVSETVYSQLAELIQSQGARLQLDNPLVIQRLIASTAELVGAQTESASVDALAQVLAINSDSLQELPVTADLNFLETVSKLKIVARGAMTDDASLLATGGIAAADFVDKYAPSNQADLAEAATVGVIEPVRIAVSDASVVEGDDGTQFAEFQIAVSDFFKQPVSVEFATEDDAATVADGDYEAVTGTIMWVPGGDAVQTIRVPVLGDNRAEFDESFNLLLQSATGALIQRSTGRGTILADDEMLFELPATVESSDVLVTVEGDQISIRQDGETIVDGSLNKAATFTLTTSTGPGAKVAIDARRVEVINRGMTLISNSPDDQLALDNTLDLDVVHQIVTPNTGSYVAENQAIAYQGFSQVTNKRAPSFSLQSDVVLDQPTTAVATLPPLLDLDGSTSRWSLSFGENEIATQDGLEPFDFTPVEPGPYRLSFTITLQDDTIVSAIQHFDVQPLNAPPEADAGGAYTVHEGLSVVLDASASTDPDLPSDVLSFQWDLDGDGVFGETGASAAWGDETGAMPTFDASTLDGPSTLTVSLRVTDSYGESSTDTATINVANAAPVLTVDATDVTLVEGDSANKRITATDVPADTVSVVANLGEITANEDGTWTWTFDSTDDLPDTPVVITASDEDGESSEATFNLSVANAKPNLTVDTTNVTLLEGDSASKLITATDVPADTVSVGATLGEITANEDGTWTWSFDSTDDLPDTPVVITASDEDGGSSDATFNLSVANAKPNLTVDTTNVTLLEGDSASKLITATDVPADTVSVGATLGEITANEDGTWTWSFDSTDDLPDTLVVITASDEDGGSSEATFNLSVANAKPLITAIETIAAEENGIARVEGAFADPGLLDEHLVTINWGDGTTTQANVDFSTRTFSAEHVFLDDPTGVDTSDYEIIVSVDDLQPNGVAEQTAVVSVGNIAPKIGNVNLQSWSRDAKLTFDLSDIGTLDTHQVAVDWGDGEQTVVSAPTGPLQLQHTYADGGIYSVSVTVTDDDGGSARVDAQAFATGAAVRDGVLEIVGTSSSDAVRITKVGSRHFVTANFLPGFLRTKAFRREDYSQIVVHAGDGNDWVSAAGSVSMNLLLHGGTGDDYLKAAKGDDILIGDDGNDWLDGMQGDDLLIGGRGSDTIIGKSGSDLLIAGYTSFDDHRDSLFAIRDEWTAARGYNARRENLLGTNDDDDQFELRLNGENFLIADGPDQTVFDDDSADRLFGGGGRDWYFASLVADDDEKDRIFGLAKNEDVEELD